MPNLPIEYLNWDSDFYNRRIARITSGCINVYELAGILEWAIKERIDCLYYLANGQVTGATNIVESNGFHLIDLRVSFIKDLTKPEQALVPMWNIRQADEKDLPILKKMARKSFPISRFHLDKHFNQVKADQMYEVWVEKDLRRGGKDVWVIDAEEQLVAFTTVSSKVDGKAQIGLVSTQESWRGRGLTLELQRFICDKLRNEGIGTVEVVTQGRNIAAQRLYQRAGYLISSIDLWYHKWFD